MKKYTYTIRWVAESIVIMAVLAAVPWLYYAFSCPFGSYYDPDAWIFISDGVEYSSVASRPLTANKKIAVFTNVYFPWLKGYQVSSQWSADKDRWWNGQGGYTELLDTVDYKVSVGGNVIDDWAPDTSSIFYQTMAISTWSPGSSPYTGSYSLTCEVRDTNHQGPPGTTDDASNGTDSSDSIEWVIPTSETQVRDFCGADPGAPPGYVGHLDRYIVTFHNGDVSFADLWIKEEITLPGQQNPSFTAKRQINASNQIPDYLYSRGLANDIIPETFTITVSQQFFIGPSENGVWVQLGWTNPPKQKVLGGYTAIQGRSQRVTPFNTAQCADWEDTLHQ